jgi:hypothetical protein
MDETPAISPRHLPPAGDFKIQSPESARPAVEVADNNRTYALDELLEQKYGAFFADKVRSRAARSVNNRTSAEGVAVTRVVTTALEQNRLYLKEMLATFIRSDPYFGIIAARGDSHENLASQIRKEIEGESLFQHVRVNEDYLRQFTCEKLVELSRQSSKAQLEQVLSDQFDFRQQEQEAVEVLGGQISNLDAMHVIRFWPLAAIRFCCEAETLINQRPEALAKTQLELKRFDSIARCLAICRDELRNIPEMRKIAELLDQSLLKLKKHCKELRSAGDRLLQSSKTVALAQLELAKTARHRLSSLAKDLEDSGLTKPAKRIQDVAELIVADANEEVINADEKPLPSTKREQKADQLWLFEVRMVNAINQSWIKLIEKYSIPTSFRKINPGFLFDRTH